ncbi:transposase [Streptomyces vietnamensis]
MEEEANQFIAELAAETDEQGRRSVIRDGHRRPRTVITGAGPVEVTALRVDDRRIDEGTGEYVRADGVHPKVRLGQAHACVLVLLGVCLDGTKELVALAEGLRESTESWADLLRDCRRRGMRDPELASGNGAMDLWKALAEVFLAARHQRC